MTHSVSRRVSVAVFVGALIGATTYGAVSRVVRHQPDGWYFDGSSGNGAWEYHQREVEPMRFHLNP